MKANQPTDKAKTCLVPACCDTEYSRGLCRRHYQSAGGMIKRGKTTWERLVALGRARPAKCGDGAWFLSPAKKG